MSRGTDEPDRFVWPPGRVAEPLEIPSPDSIDALWAEPKPLPRPSPEPQDAPPAPALPTEPAWRAMLRSTEGVLLGIAAASWPARARAAGWTPDDPSRVCPRCAEDLPPHESRDPEGCAACRGARPGWSQAVRLGRYEGVLAEALREVKFTAWRRLGDDLGRALGPGLVERLGEAGFGVDEAVLVPVPTTSARRIRTGIDHTLTIARGIRSASGIRIAEALARRGGARQIDVAASERRGNVAGVFRAKPDAAARLGVRTIDRTNPKRGRRPTRVVVVLDDIRTSGATLRACARALRAACQGGEVSIWIATVGVTPMATVKTETGKKTPLGAVSAGVEAG